MRSGISRVKIARNTARMIGALIRKVFLRPASETLRVFECFERTKRSITPKMEICQRCASTLLALVEPHTDDDFASPTLRQVIQQPNGEYTAPPTDAKLPYLGRFWTFKVCLNCGQIQGEW